MALGEVEQVLYNWISQANSQIGEFTSDTDRARWVTNNFLAWWGPGLRERLLAVEGGVARLTALSPAIGISYETEAGDEAFHVPESLRDEVRALKSVLGLE